jgi:rhomboid family GlyGly-CTERM serine protease
MFSFFEPGVRQCNFQLPWRTLLLVSIAIIVYCLAGAAPEAWVYDRASVASGEWWRLLSGHWVHSDFEHGLWDITALAILGMLFEAELGSDFFGTLAAGMIGVSLWLNSGDTWLDYYCGLSGILNALLAAGLMRLWREHAHPAIVLTAGLYLIKICAELLGGRMLLTDLAWQGVPQAHVAGLLSGMLYTYLTTFRFLPEKIDENTDFKSAMSARSCSGCRRKPCP